MNLSEAPFHRDLRIGDIRALSEDAALVLRQLGLRRGEVVEKLHTAPLGDPLTLRVGGQRFALRLEVCAKIEVTPA